MLGENGIVVSVVVATAIMMPATVAAFILLNGVPMWAGVALVVGIWLLAVRVLARRYESGQWPFGEAAPRDGQ